MSWILVIGSAFCGWAMLRTMGSERERRILEQRHATPPAPPAEPATQPEKPTSPSRSVRKQADR